MTKAEILDLYFADARSKLIDLAAFLDRIERADGEARHVPVGPNGASGVQIHPLPAEVRPSNVREYGFSVRVL